MILIFYNNKITNQDFLNYLLGITRNVLVISFNELKKVKVVDSTHENTIWHYQDRVINFNDVTGIYNEIYYLNLKDFEDYAPSDREYVCSEWTAYIMFIMQKYHTRVFNPFNHHILSGDMFNLPFIYKMSSDKGLTTPRLTISMDKMELEELSQKGEFIALTNLTEKIAFQKCELLPANCVGLIEYIIGSPIIVHVLGDIVFACEVNGNEKKEYSLPAEIKKICIQITLELGLNLSEFLFKKDLESNLILYRFSHIPRFINNSAQNLQNLYLCLGNKLLNNLSE